MQVLPPETESELLERAWVIAGLTLGQLGKKLKIKTPENLLHNKGWIGETLELALGATAGSRPEPDFQQIGVELKSIPVLNNGQPRETTHICTTPLTDTAGLNWKSSLVYKKLFRVLWIPIETHNRLTLSERRIGAPLLWSPTDEQENLLKNDWEELMEMISLGDLDKITADMGEAIQIRPKAANSHALSNGIGHKGEHIKTLPRGFYLRTSFTAELLRKHYQFIV